MGLQMRMLSNLPKNDIRFKPTGRLILASHIGLFVQAFV